MVEEQGNLIEKRSITIVEDHFMLVQVKVDLKKLLLKKDTKRMKRDSKTVMEESSHRTVGPLKLQSTFEL